MKCKWCGKELITTNKKKVFCNDTCKNRYGSSQRKIKNDEIKNYCIMCGVIEIKKTATYCPDCYQKHLIEKHNEMFNDKECCVCEICGWKAKALTQHLSDKHSISLKDYMEKYNKTLDECILKSSRKLWSDKIKGENNGAFNHGGKYSPYSKKFIKYENLSEDEKTIKIDTMYVNLSEKLTDGTGRLPTQVEHWTKQGFTEEEAKDKITDLQTTFSLDICVDKYGEEGGLKRWKERQDKWLSNYKKQNFSLISQKLFWELYNIIRKDFYEIYFAQFNQETGLLEENRNYEYILYIGKSFCKLDFFIKDINKAIEFDGDYWHGEKRGNKERDRIRTELIEQTGVKVLHIAERNYNNDSKSVINKCLDFIYDRGIFAK